MACVKKVCRRDGFQMMRRWADSRYKTHRGLGTWCQKHFQEASDGRRAQQRGGSYPVLSGSCAIVWLMRSGLSATVGSVGEVRVGEDGTRGRR